MINESVESRLAKKDPLPEHYNHKEFKAMMWAFDKVKRRWTDPPLKLIDSSPPLSTLRDGIHNSQFIRLPEIERLAQDPDSIHLANRYIQRHLEETARHKTFFSKPIIWQILHYREGKDLSRSLAEERRIKSEIVETITYKEKVTIFEFEVFWRFVGKLGLFSILNQDGSTTEVVRKPEYMHEFE